MNEYLNYLVLNILDKKESIGTIFKLGYSYSEIVKLFDRMEQDGYIRSDEEVERIITNKGKNKLLDLEKRYRNEYIVRLEYYRIKKKALDDVYLP